MPKLQLPKAWRAISFIAIIAILGSIVLYFVVMPRVEAWMTKKFPEAFAVQTALQAQYPQKKIGVNDQTLFSNDAGSNKKERVLVVSVIGDSQLNAKEITKAKGVICDALGKHAQKYSKVVLQSTIEHRFLIFFSRQSESASFTCSD